MLNNLNIETLFNNQSFNNDIFKTLFNDLNVKNQIDNLSLKTLINNDVKQPKC